MGPDKSVLQQQLQAQLPSYWQVKSFHVEGQENLGNQVEPLVLVRFKASAELQEDTFYSVGNLDNIPLKKQEGISFLKKAESRGQKVDIYGVSTSKRSADTWNNEFRFDTNPTANTSQPRSNFSGKVILLDSPEESEFRDEVKKQVKAEKEVVLNMVSNKGKFSGERTGSEKPFHSFLITFTSFDSSSNTFTGQMEYPGDGAILEFKGSISEGINLQFKTTQVIKCDHINVGSEYILSLVNLDRMEGKRTYVGMANIPLAEISPFGPEKQEESVVLYLK
ncbi:MAG: hypothetical protein KME30_26070 [Iphinoe sp. HA4291-MV1]|nr:hypothetical protein [Iphinoe sp. HA4291-MV1]